jgi:hypothetical protein
MNQSPEQVTDELIYRSYRYNRERFPEIPAVRFAMAYPNGAALEERYQGEINAYANLMTKLDQSARYQSRPEHDMRCDGMPVKAGT